MPGWPLQSSIDNNIEYANINIGTIWLMNIYHQDCCWQHLSSPNLQAGSQPGFPLFPDIRRNFSPTGQEAEKDLASEFDLHPICYKKINLLLDAMMKVDCLVHTTPRIPLQSLLML